MDWEWLENRIFERTLTADERNTLQAVIQQVEFAEGERIMVQNAPGGTLYLLRSGRVAVELEFCGETVHLADVGEGAQLGDMSFVDEQGAGATLIARTPCVAYKLTRDDLSRLYAYRQDMVNDLLVHTLKGMSSTIRNLNEAKAAALQYIHGRRT
ncbi:MAG TPA: cyclic nucleotide-binding domain-containing protein [Mariprofundaceae bacterium]|nr:cyclic nucleotide-binding domain-containing protein [Mariprofundaceae bacterium]